MSERDKKVYLINNLTNSGLDILRWSRKRSISDFVETFSETSMRDEHNLIFDTAMAMLRSFSTKRSITSDFRDEMQYLVDLWFNCRYDYSVETINQDMHTIQRIDEKYIERGGNMHGNVFDKVFSLVKETLSGVDYMSKNNKEAWRKEKWYEESKNILSDSLASLNCVAEINCDQAYNIANSIIENLISFREAAHLGQSPACTEIYNLTRQWQTIPTQRKGKVSKDCIARLDKLVDEICADDFSGFCANQGDGQGLESSIYTLKQMQEQKETEAKEKYEESRNVMDGINAQIDDIETQKLNKVKELAVFLKTNNITDVNVRNRRLAEIENEFRNKKQRLIDIKGNAGVKESIYKNLYDLRFLIGSKLENIIASYEICKEVCTYKELNNYFGFLSGVEFTRWLSAKGKEEEDLKNKLNEALDAGIAASNIIVTQISDLRKQGMSTSQIRDTLLKQQEEFDYDAYTSTSKVNTQQPSDDILKMFEGLEVENNTEEVKETNEIDLFNLESYNTKK